MDKDLKKIFDEVAKELESAEKKFPKFNSPHEGYAIIKEELDEVWEEVRANDNEKACEEAVQVAAMAIRFIKDLKR